MYSLAPEQPRASAGAVLCGESGDVTRLAPQRGAGRQAVYRQAHAAARAVDGSATGLLVNQLRQENAALRQTVADLQRRLAGAVVIDTDHQAEFAATAQGKGVSFTAARALLAVFLRDRTPSRARLARWAREAGRQAGPTLAVLDSFSRPRARQITADEMFSGRRPVLMTAEQHSLCWLGGRLATNRDGMTWAEEFRQLPAAEQVTGDRGQGLRKGLAIANGEPQAAGLRAVRHQSDHFHPLRRGQQQAQQVRRQGERALQAAEPRERARDQAGPRGGTPTGA